jgi:predicted transglutaminase-like cysteine proteinase
MKTGIVLSRLGRTIGLCVAWGCGFCLPMPAFPQEAPAPDTHVQESHASDPGAAAPAPHKFHSYFINREVRADNIQMFPKWMDMLARYDAESHTLDSICGHETYSTCKLKDWKDFLEGLRGKPMAEQMEAINGFVNKYPYVEDIVNWGVEDYWETPYEFQRKNGDCEDYAIAKFMSLRALGVANDAMRVFVVRDLNLGGIIHAVLIVFNADSSFMLDNQIEQVVPTSKIYHYMPVYSINEAHWWQHFMLD